MRNGGTPSRTAIRDSFHLARSTSAIFSGSSDKVSNSIPPDRTAGSPMFDMRACTQAVCSSYAWVAFRLAGCFRTACGIPPDAANCDGVAGRARWPPPAGRRRPRAGRDRGRRRWSPGSGHAARRR